ncbi:dipeptidase PepV [Alicyclobacillus fastidiosus]|uniref:Dipeptidase PepV n=1 Tax=Alicyclobacillus fastidiosus TaxID=392011 RepID=A0ABV5AB56_9BACL|nr:dipeptidase PepV [Alicyclobacillus fastidiosus]WEH11797.1 dipeptidase PepV [Alicyclobacillus fastidiosus]
MFKDFVEQHRDTMISTLQDLLRIESVKGHPVPDGPFGTGPAQALSYMLKLAYDRGFVTKNVDGFAGHVEYGEGDEYIAVVSHLDVVPAGDGWRHPPYGAEIDQGKVYARGAIDDKGPAMSTLWALFAMKEMGIQPKRKIRVIFGLDEESDWQCMEHYFRYEPKPIGGFTPDASFPLIYAEKGLATLRIDVAADAESMSAQVLKFEGGERFNMVPAHALAEVDCHSSTAANEFALKIRKSAKDAQIDAAVETEDSIVRIRVEGVSAHASRPAAGVNAVVHLAHLLGMGTVSNSSMWRTVGSWDTAGRALGIDAEDDETGPLTANLGRAELVDGTYQFYINIRFPIRMTVDQLLQGAQTYLSDKWQVSIVEHMPPLYVDPASPLVQTLMGVYAAHFEDDATPISIGGATYARAIPNAVAFGALFPEREDFAHRVDENWALDDFLTCVEIYAEAMTQLANTL